MSTIITGNFQQQLEAEHALSELAGAGFAADQAATFFFSSAGQHALYPIGGDEKDSPGTEASGVGAASGAAVGGVIGAGVGLAALPVLGVGMLVAAASAGACAGSLFGGLTNLGDEPDANSPIGKREALLGSDHVHRKAGMLVAVSAPASAQQNAAIRILRAHGATDIESPEGTIVAGEWTDFDPLTPLNLVAN